MNPAVTYTARVPVKDPDDDELSYYWSIKPESDTTAEGGDNEAIIQDIPGLIENPYTRQIIMLAPTNSGAYRLFVQIYDGEGHAAYANVPFRVSAE